jgi:molybdate transport system regulatory protein
VFLACFQERNGGVRRVAHRHNRAMTDSSLPLNEALGHTASDKRLDVLRRVGHTGSISQAARDVGISYKAAWQAIETLTNLSGWPLVDRSVGGSGGGGARLTADGQRLLVLADELARARAQVLARFATGQLASVGPTTGQAGMAEVVWGSGGMGLRTSMRNQMPCTVTGVQAQGQGPMVRVALTSAGGGQLASLVTQESVDLLGLVPGQAVLVLCKATAVTVTFAAMPAVTPEVTPEGMPEEPSAVSSSDACVLHGVVADVSDGPGPQEVALTLAGGHLWVGFASVGEANAVDASRTLTVGDAASATFTPAALVIGLPG